MRTVVRRGREAHEQRQAAPETFVLAECAAGSGPGNDRLRWQRVRPGTPATAHGPAQQPVAGVAGHAPGHRHRRGLQRQRRRCQAQLPLGLWRRQQQHAGCTHAPLRQGRQLRRETGAEQRSRQHAAIHRHGQRRRSGHRRRSGLQCRGQRRLVLAEPLAPRQQDHRLRLAGRQPRLGRGRSRHHPAHAKRRAQLVGADLGREPGPAEGGLRR